jgi:hypothetical protein
MYDIYEIALEIKVANALGASHQQWFALIIRDFWSTIS